MVRNLNGFKVRNKISNWRVAGFPYGDVVSLIGANIGISKETSITDLALELKVDILDAPHALMSFYENSNFIRKHRVK